jgi:hypothetical protein
MSSVYRRREQIIVHGNTQVEGMGGWATSEPHYVLRGTVSPETLGHCVLEAMHTAPASITPPADWSEVGRSLYKAVGVGGWGQFVRGAKYCTVCSDGVALVLVPTRSGVVARRRGFQFLTDHEIKAKLPLSEVEVGELVLQCLERCM